VRVEKQRGEGMTREKKEGVKYDGMEWDPKI